MQKPRQFIQMNFISKTWNSIRNVTGGRSQLSAPSIENKRSLLHKLKQTATTIEDRQLRDWRDAVEAAIAPENPNRLELQELYRVVMNDAHLLAQVRTAENQVVLSDFDILVNDQPSEELKRLIEKTWFDRYLKECVQTELWGFTLIEFNASALDESNHFTKIFVVPRDHVRPEYGDVVFNLGSTTGVSFTKGAHAKYLMPIGDSHDLGLLKELAPLVIRKSFNMLDWARRNEKFGMPFVVARTQSRQENELDAKEAMLRNFGTHMYAILDDLDQIDFIEPKVNAAAHLTYHSFIEMMDKAISQLVNGQSGTQDEQAYVGSAEVHERMLNSYTKARLRRIQSHINDSLLPFLSKHGYPFVGAKFEFTALRPGADMQTTEDEGDSQSGNEGK